MGHPWLKHCTEFCFIACCKIHAEVRDMSLLGALEFLHFAESKLTSITLGLLKACSMVPSDVIIECLFPFSLIVSALRMINYTKLSR